MGYIALYSTVVVFLVLYLYVEARRHQENINAIPLRIHVNGTRGKSSVTRLIAAGLRAGGHCVVAKTTGTEAKIIYPDGNEEKIVRRGPANVRENIKVVETAVKVGATALVVECMALNPELQKFCEEKLIKSTIGVITNIRMDHEDVMGNSIEAIARALSNTVPVSGTLVTTPEAERLLEKYCKEDRRVTASERELDNSLLQGFNYEVISANVALALKVCELAGVERKTAIEGMRLATPDAGNLKVNIVAMQNGKAKFINALAANDPESTKLLWDNFVKEDESVIVFLNCRKDREYRTLQLGKLFSQMNIGYFILAGDTAGAKAMLVKQGVDANQIFLLKSNPVFEDLLLVINSLSIHDVTVFAAGNVKGLSSQFVSQMNGG